MGWFGHCRLRNCIKGMEVARRLTGLKEIRIHDYMYFFSSLEQALT